MITMLKFGDHSPVQKRDRKLVRVNFSKNVWDGHQGQGEKIDVTISEVIAGNILAPIPSRFLSGGLMQHGLFLCDLANQALASRRCEFGNHSLVERFLLEQTCTSPRIERYIREFLRPHNGKFESSLTKVGIELQRKQVRNSQHRTWKCNVFRKTVEFTSQLSY